jgi:WD40 repeat protein
VRLFDLSKGVELGELQEHQDSVSCLDFAGVAALITAGDDGQACIWRISDWELLLKFRAHKVAVASVAAHSSGRLMASAGRDKSLRLWDLTRGTSAANLAVDAVAEVLEWAPDGNHLAALSLSEITLVDVRTASVSSYKELSSKGGVKVSLCATTFLRNDVLIVGDDRATLRVLKAEDGSLKEVCCLAADADRKGRVKAIARCSEDDQGLTFAVGMSLGRVEIWRLAHGRLPASGGEEAFSRLQVVDTGARLTCLAAWCGQQPNPKAGTSTTASVEAVKNGNSRKRKKKQTKK